MGRTQKAIKNVVFSMISQIFSVSLTFVSRTVFIWGFGVSYLGLNGLFADVLGLLSMADLGMGTAMVFSFYKPLADNDTKKMAALTTYYKKIYMVIAASVTLIGITLIPFLKFLINVDKPIDGIVIFYLLSLANVVASYFCVYKSSVLTADQNGHIVSKITIFTNIIKTIIQIIVIVLFENYYIYLGIGVFSTLLNNMVASKIASKKYSFVNEYEELDKVEKKNIITNIISVFIYKISSVLLSATDNILISSIVGTIVVGYYSNYLLIQNKIVLMYSLVFSALTASIGNLVAKESAEKQKEIFDCEQSISFIVSMIVVPCYVGLADDFVRIWLGKDFVMGSYVVLAIGINMYLASVLQPLWSYREATGIYRETKWVMLICAIINIILSIVLGIWIGVVGIILASAIARLTTYVWYEPGVLFIKYFKQNPLKFYINFLKNAILTTILCLGTLSVKYIFDVRNIWEWFVKAVIIGVIVVLITILTYRNAEGVKILKNRFIKRV